jgi:hypothetical protein
MSSDHPQSSIARTRHSEFVIQHHASLLMYGVQRIVVVAQSLFHFLPSATLQTSELLGSGLDPRRSSPSPFAGLAATDAAVFCG